MNKKRPLIQKALAKVAGWIGRRRSRNFKRLRNKAIAFDLLMGMPEANLARIYKVSIDTVRRAKRRAPESNYIRVQQYLTQATLKAEKWRQPQLSLPDPASLPLPGSEAGHSPSGEPL